MCVTNRQMKGEELQGLGLEELKKLEKSLLGGLSRVAEMMVNSITLLFWV